MMRSCWTIARLAAVSGLLAGCAAMAVSGASQGVTYTFSNVAYRTFTSSKPQVDAAIVQALKRMQIKYLRTTKEPAQDTIFAQTKDLKIEIAVTSVTPKATKVAVNAKKDYILKDRAVAAEIIHQIEVALAAP